jgi:hypothetical protein
MAGCYSLGDEALRYGPEPVSDNVILRCLICDLLDSTRLFIHQFVRSRGDSYLTTALQLAGLEREPGVPDPVLLSRLLKQDRDALAKMWEVIDKWGMPDGILGDTFRHMDKFRTF